MSPLRIFMSRPGDRAGSRYSIRICESEWVKHHVLIKELHEEGYTREAIRERLLEEYGFRPS